MRSFRPSHAIRALLAVAALLCLPAQAAPLQVVASFSILADMAREVGGERVAIVSLIGPDEDAHGYQARPSDAKRIKEADVVIANGLGFDGWIERLAASSGSRRPIVIASEGVAAIAQDETHDHDAGHDGHGHDHGPQDPHAWQDVSQARRYVANIAQALSAADPDGTSVYQANAARYDAELQALDQAIRDALAGLPAERRKFVTSHDAFAYFGHAYGLRVIAATGISNEAEPSAAGIARLIRQLRREHVPAVFAENISDQRLIERIGQEGGARLGGKLYSDALSRPDGAAGSYVAMMRHNLSVLLDGLANPPAPPARSTR